MAEASTLNKTELHTSKGRQINPSWPFPIYRAKDECTWNFKPTATFGYNKGIFMHKVLNNNNSPSYLALLFISHQSHYTNSRNNLYVPRPRLDLFKTSNSIAGASFWNSLPQNKKSCISVPCFKRNLQKYMSENNLSSNLDGFVWITRLPKKMLYTCMPMKEI